MTLSTLEAVFMRVREPLPGRWHGWVRNGDAG